MKGCLLKILKKILIIVLLIAFFAFGGYAFLKKKINDYKYPPRDVFVEAENAYADFSKVPADFQLYRCFNLFGYKKIGAKYTPTGQKITIFDLKDEDLVSVSDYYTGELDNKINKILDKAKDAFITYENFEIIKKGIFVADDNKIPYIIYKANVKNIPFKEVIGVFALYSRMNESQKASTKVIFTVVDKKSFNHNIISSFIRSLRF